MSPARRDPAPGAQKAAGALAGPMDAALAPLADRGLLAGLDRREVAHAVGDSPANIRSWFGSRRISATEAR